MSGFDATAIGVSLLAQIWFMIAVLLARAHFGSRPFGPAAFRSWRFALIEALRLAGTVAQMALFARLDLGLASTVFAAVAIVAYPLLGALVLREPIDRRMAVASGLVLAAVALLALPA